MQTDSFVDGEEVVAMVLDDVSSALTFSCAEVKASIEAGRFGQYKKVTRDFLSLKDTTTTITMP